MLERLGMRDWRDLATWLCLVLLVALTPAGKEATHPLIIGLYRTLLLFLIVTYTVWTDRARLPRLSLWFVGALALVFAIMLISTLRWDGSLFEGFYVFYEYVLFIAAFVAVAHSGIERTRNWKHGILAAVVLINVGYLVGAMALSKRPLLGPFVNPNYFASFVLPGLAVCAATVFLASTRRVRIAAAGAGLLLFYGIGQTASRGATLAGLALLGLAAFRAARRRGVSRIAMALAAGVLLIVTAAFNPRLVGKFLDRGERDPYNYQRGQIWLGTLAMIGTHPVTGVGPGHFRYIAKRFTPPVESTVARYGRYPNIAHSQYLQYMAEIGIPGALLLFGLGASLFLFAWRRAENVPHEDSIIQESALLAAVGLGTHALVDNNFTVPVMAVGLAVVSQADLLPLRGRSPGVQLTSTWRHALALTFLAVWVDAALIPAVGFHFNDAGHKAHLAKNFESAELNHRLALAIIPRHAVLLDNLGTVYLDEFIKTRKPEYLDRAEILFTRAMAENPHHDIPAGHLENALMQRLTQDFRQDSTIHRKIVDADQHLLRANPFNPFIRKNLAEAFYNLGDKHQAREELRRAIEMEPNYVPAYLRLAEWHQEAGETEESVKYRKQAIQVVNLYKDKTSLEPFDELLLGRPQSQTKP